MKGVIVFHLVRDFCLASSVCSFRFEYTLICLFHSLSVIYGMNVSSFVKYMEPWICRPLCQRFSQEIITVKLM